MGSFRGCTCLKCTNKATIHTKGVHLSPLGFAACQSKKCTNRAEDTNRAMTHATEIILPQIAQIFTDPLGA